MLSRLAPVIIAVIVASAGCASEPSGLSGQSRDEQAIDQLLEQLHQRASAADFDGYFDLYAEGAVFLGTDKTEYWPLADFKAYTQPHFAAGNGWTYSPVERKLHTNGRTAWFEERLLHKKYGEVRGTGVAINTSRGWKVAQYNLALPLPNELFGDIAQDVSRFYDRERGSTHE